MHLFTSVVDKNSSSYSSAMQEILSQSGQSINCVRLNGDLGGDGGGGDSERWRIQSNVGVSLIVLVF